LTSHRRQGRLRRPASRHRHLRELGDSSFRATRKSSWTRLTCGCWGSKNTRPVSTARIKMLAFPLRWTVKMFVCIRQPSLCPFFSLPFPAPSCVIPTVASCGGALHRLPSPHQAAPLNWHPSDHLSGRQTCLLAHPAHTLALTSANPKACMLNPDTPVPVEVPNRTPLYKSALQLNRQSLLWRERQKAPGGRGTVELAPIPIIEHVRSHAVSSSAPFTC
jgi:hypothetical protein